VHNKVLYSAYTSLFVHVFYLLWLTLCQQNEVNFGILLISYLSAIKSKIYLFSTRVTCHYTAKSNERAIGRLTTISLSVSLSAALSFLLSLSLSLSLCPVFETKDDYYFNVVNVNDAILLIIQLTSYKCFLRTSGGPKAAPFAPLDFFK